MELNFEIYDLLLQAATPDQGKNAWTDAVVSRPNKDGAKSCKDVKQVKYTIAIFHNFSFLNRVWI